MAMNATQVTLNVKGVNKTGKVFKEIAASAAHVAKTSAMIGGAAFGGASVAFAATTKSLASLADSAMRAGASASELSKLSNTLDYLGIKSSSPDELASAFQNMTKSIGESGVEGFQRAIKSIAQLETASDRSKAAMEVFGKSGMNFLPLIEAAARGSESAFNDVMKATPGVSEAAIKAAGEVDAAMKTVTQGSKVLWANAIGEIARLFDAQFAGGVREAALKANAYMEYASLVAGRYVVAFFTQSSTGVERWRAVWDEAIKAVKRKYYEFFVFIIEYSKTIGERLKLGLKNATVGFWYSLTRNSEGRAAIDAEFDAMRNRMYSKIDKDLKLLGVNVSDTFSKGVANVFKDVSIDDLDKKLQEKLSDAVRAAAAAGSAAVSTVVTDSAKGTASDVEKALKSLKTPWMDSNEYKTATLSMRADYGKTSDVTVKAVDKVRAVNEEMKTVLEKISSSIDAIPAV